MFPSFLILLPCCPLPPLVFSSLSTFFSFTCCHIPPLPYLPLSLHTFCHSPPSYSPPPLLFIIFFFLYLLSSYPFLIVLFLYLQSCSCSSVPPLIPPYLPPSPIVRV